jgi:DNA polymerase III epsilon subunit-like protein
MNKMAPLAMGELKRIITTSNIQRCRLPPVFVECKAKRFDDNPELIEVAAVKFVSCSRTERYESLVRPATSGLSWAAMATSHVTPEQLAGAAPFEDIEEDLKAFCGDAVIVAQGAARQRRLLRILQQNLWLDSYRLGRHVWPDAESHFHWGLYCGLVLHRDAPIDGAPHGAFAWAYVTAEVTFAAIAQLVASRGNLSLEDVLAIAASPFRSLRGTVVPV